MKHLSIQNQPTSLIFICSSPVKNGGTASFACCIHFILFLSQMSIDTTESQSRQGDTWYYVPPNQGLVFEHYTTRQRNETFKNRKGNEVFVPLHPSFPATVKRGEKGDFGAEPVAGGDSGGPPPLRWSFRRRRGGRTTKSTRGCT